MEKFEIITISDSESESENEKNIPDVEKSDLFAITVNDFESDFSDTESEDLRLYLSDSEIESEKKSSTESLKSDEFNHLKKLFLHKDLDKSKKDSSYFRKKFLEILRLVMCVNYLWDIKQRKKSTNVHSPFLLLFFASLWCLTLHKPSLLLA